NQTETTIEIPEGTPSKDDLGVSDMGTFAEPPPISPRIMPGAGFTPVDDDPRGQDVQEEFPPPASRGNARRKEVDPFAADGAAESNAGGQTGRAPARSKSILVGSPQFPLQYEVDDAGPDGPNTVELWVTPDGGRTWSRRGEDPDRRSPFPVDLGGEGT